MQFVDWRSAVVADLQAELPHERQERHEVVLARIYWLMQTAPKTVDEAYRKLDEDWLEAEARERAKEFGRKGKPSSRLPKPEDDEAALARLLAVEARATDIALFQVRDSGRPADPNVDWLVPTQPPTLVIPRAKEPGPLGARGLGQPFVRRGVRCHRIMPRTISGAEVLLLAPPIHGPGEGGEEAWLGSAIFGEVKLQLDAPRPEGGFLVTGLENGAALQDELKSQISQALAEAEGCLAAVWPELTIPPEMLTELKVELALRGLSDDPGSPPGIILAGSWHLAGSGGGAVNVSPVLDGTGNQIFDYWKMTRFNLTGRGAEDITLGERLPVLVYGDMLIAFAICKDFCDAGADPPYHEMPVDLVLVPSFGNRKTVVNHLQTANTIRVRHNARSFVVQQALAAPWGWVVAAPEDPASETPDSCVQKEVWKRHRLSRR